MELDTPALHHDRLAFGLTDNCPDASLVQSIRHLFLPKMLYNSDVSDLTTKQTSITETSEVKLQHHLLFICTVNL